MLINNDASSHILFRNEISGDELLFENPIRMLVAHTGDELIDVLNQIDVIRSQNQWVAGYLSYEAGFCLEEKIKPLLPDNRRIPLACFGVFDGPSSGGQQSCIKTGHDQQSRFSDIRALWEFDLYKEKFDQLMQHMQQGDCYQGNLTFPMVAKWQGCAFDLFEQLAKIQPVSHAAYVDLQGPIILSRSPEMFFRVERDGWIESRPMKGTAPRGKTRQEDEQIAAALQKDPKNISENVMIVDLLRNDISHISKAGSVHVPQLYELKSFATVHQLVSRVRGHLLEDVRFIDIMKALFPCGSITGAPKIRAMEILHELEGGEPRDAYCGAIGWVEPSGAMQFNVPIRTISLYDDQMARFNVGGGITLGSQVESEYNECLLKAKFATVLNDRSR